MHKRIIKFFLFLLLPFCCLSCDELNFSTNDEEIFLEPSVIIEDNNPSRDTDENLSESDWNLSVDVILKGTFLCSQIFCPHFQLLLK